MIYLVHNLTLNYSEIKNIVSCNHLYIIMRQTPLRIEKSTLRLKRFFHNRLLHKKAITGKIDRSEVWMTNEKWMLKRYKTKMGKKNTFFLFLKSHL